MDTLEEKFKVIEKLLRTVSITTDQEFSEEERLYIEEQFNIRFKKLPKEFMCYYSTRPGVTGLSPGSLNAFVLLLSILRFQRNPSLGFSEDLKGFLTQLQR